MEVTDAVAEERSDTAPAGGDGRSEHRETGPHVQLPSGPGRPAGQPELEHRDRSARTHDAGELAHGRCGIVDVAEQVGERQAVEGRVVERKLLGGSLDELDAVGEAGGSDTAAAGLEHVAALVEADDAAAGAPDELDRDRGRAGGDVENRGLVTHVHPRDEEAAPARVLPEREEPGVAIVGRGKRREQLDRVHRMRVYGCPVALKDDLERIAEAAASFAADGEPVSAVFAAEPPTGGRVYLCAYGEGDELSWLALDDRGQPVTDRARVRAAASLVALTEVAEESAGGGELDELLSRLAALRLTENPPGIDEAEEAVLALQRALGAPPRLATPEFLDEVGAATMRLEESLGEASESPFVLAMKNASSAVEALTADVEANYKRDLA